MQVASCCCCCYRFRCTLLKPRSPHSRSWLARTHSSRQLDPEREHDQFQTRRKCKSKTENITRTTQQKANYVGQLRWLTDWLIVWLQATSLWTSKSSLPQPPPFGRKIRKYTLQRRKREKEWGKKKTRKNEEARELVRSVSNARRRRIGNTFCWKEGRRTPSRCARGSTREREREREREKGRE